MRACAGLVAGVETLVLPVVLTLPVLFELCRCVHPRNIGLPLGETPQVKGLNGSP